ncbi:MAG: dehydrogenase, partial [Armatimonadota bacterium]
MHNSAIDATWTYHDGTKHSYRSVRAGARGLDWPNQPLPFKIYSTLEPISLPPDFPHPTMPALDAIAALGVEPPGRVIPDVHTLAGILYFSAGITKRFMRGGGALHFRAAASTGALYHIELYVVCGALQDPAAGDRGLAAGVYHFGVHDFALRRLRAGDYRPALVSASAGEPSIAAAPA